MSPFNLFTNHIFIPWIRNVFAFFTIDPLRSAVLIVSIKIFRFFFFVALVIFLLRFVSDPTRFKDDWFEILILVSILVGMQFMLYYTKIVVQRIEVLRKNGIVTDATDWKISFAFPFSFDKAVRKVCFEYVVAGQVYWTSPQLIGESTAFEDSAQVVYDPKDPSFGFYKVLLEHGATKEVTESLLGNKEQKSPRRFH